MIQNLTAASSSSSSFIRIRGNVKFVRQIGRIQKVSAISMEIEEDDPYTGRERERERWCSEFRVFSEVQKYFW